MHNSLRTSLGAVLTAAVVLSVPVLSAAAPASHGRTVTGSHRYTRAEATAVFNRLENALKPKHAAPRKLGDPLPRVDLSLLMRQARLARASMTARQQSIIDSNGRPVPVGQGCTDYSPLLQAKWVALAGTHFCVHYRPSLTDTNGGATLAEAQATLSTMEDVYAAEVTGLGYHPPLNDGDNLVDVFLDQLGDQGYYGFCTTDSDTSTSTAWCGLDNNFSTAEFGAPPTNSRRVTAAHEFFHAIQFGYDVGGDEDTWFLEGTAVWMEDQVYPKINDYLQYLPLSQIVKPRNSTDYAGNLERYGAVTFWKFLSERFHDVNIIRQVWQAASVAAGNRNGIQAVVAVLRARGYAFAPEFARYAVWNTLPPGTYRDRSLFPHPGIWASGTMTRSKRDTGVLSVNLNHLANAPLVLRPAAGLPSRTKLRISINAPDTSHGSQVRVQLRYRSGKVLVYTVHLDATGSGSKLFPFNPNYLRSALVTMSNASTGYYNNQTFKVRGKISY